MPPKLDRCVSAVEPRTGTSRAYAICTASLQRAGELPRKKNPMKSRVHSPFLGETVNVRRTRDGKSLLKRGEVVSFRSDGRTGIRFGQSGAVTFVKNDKIRRLKTIKKIANPRTPCGSVSSKRNKYVGATFTKVRGAAKGTRRVIGCARVGDDEGYYATRKVGAKGTRYTPIKKRALRDLKHNHKGAVKPVRHRGVARTSAALVSAFEARYAPKPKKRAVKNPSRKMSAADKAAFVKRMAAARARKAR